MASASSEETVWRFDLPNEEATVELAALVGGLLRAEDLVTLSGDLGAGKTTFARALIRRLADDPSLEVPSPTFTLMQLYSGRSFPILHADLYRLQRASELMELGWDEATDGALVLVEWADRASSALSRDRLDVSFEMKPKAGEEARTVYLTGHGAFARRLSLAKARTELLEKTGWKGATSSFMVGDASSRLYERLTHPDGRTAVLMISPRKTDGPPIRLGKPYSAIAHLAEDIRPFVAVSEALRKQGMSAPEIFAFDERAGLALLEDFGTGGFLVDDRPAHERYGEAVLVLATLHVRELPDVLPLGESDAYAVPQFDAEAMSVEVELALDWFAPHIAGVSLASGARATFLGCWRRLFDEIEEAEKTWVLRDYHSPNLIWLDERRGEGRVGILDFQDCVIGSPAYDLASLLQDARVTIPDDMELRLLSIYAGLRRNADPDFDVAKFARAYAIMAAQRATKILGIFARLDKRDHKPAYLAHLPRVQAYLRKDLSHPALAEMRSWFETFLPQALTPTS